ncbi:MULTISPECIES: hypothetical protein [unclassified Variovorax]|uniref:hypothetical protein n=1 Tax=unclassified Variovorax TaxID=663243 RepID=UPI00076C9CA8|nr:MULTISPECIES: hypothetical protein [unclassified Variovorax]KWT65713.1 hypothetical protein APY03_7340 [Variovorax sp. WDL1]
MKSTIQPTTHEWWEDHTDQAEQRAFLDSYRSAQRIEHAVAWRRNVMLGFLAVAVPFLVRLLSTL